MLCKEATHTAPYLVCFGGGVEGSSVAENRYKKGIGLLVMEGVTDTDNPAITLSGAGLLSTLGAEYI